VGVGLEVGIDEIGNLPRMPVQLDQVRPVESSMYFEGIQGAS
jgi:hypothetical protein